MGLLSTTHNHITKGTTQYVTKEINVTEKRAPTDESIRLLNEMQDKARKNIILTIPIENNILTGIAIMYQDTVVRDAVLLHIRFTLNGKDYIIEEDFNKLDWIQMKHEAKEWITYEEREKAEQLVIDTLLPRVGELIGKILLKESKLINHIINK